MAANLQISIKEPAVARAWLDMVQGINEDYFRAMKEAGETLNEMNNFADGTLVDEFVNFGTSILNAAQATSDAIKTIADTVNTVLSKVTDFTDNVVSSIGKTIGKLFG